MRASEVARLQQYTRTRTARLARAGDMARRGLALDAEPAPHLDPPCSSIDRHLVPCQTPSTHSRGLRLPTASLFSLTRSLRRVRPSCSGCARASSRPPVAGVCTVR
ncbi:hypothetical protein V8D89_014987 [Ganoderma adspersum]